MNNRNVMLQYMSNYEDIVERRNEMDCIQCAGDTDINFSTQTSVLTCGSCISCPPEAQ